MDLLDLESVESVAAGINPIKKHQNDKIYNRHYKQPNTAIKILDIIPGDALAVEDAMMIQILDADPANTTVRQVAATGRGCSSLLYQTMWAQSVCLRLLLTNLIIQVDSRNIFTIFASFKSLNYRFKGSLFLVRNRIALAVILWILRGLLPHRRQ